MRELSEKAKSVKPGIYEHYKGVHYRVYGVALYSETLEEVVIYKSLDDDALNDDHYWLRPIGIFLEDVEVDGIQKPRFKLIEESIHRG